MKPRVVKPNSWWDETLYRYGRFKRLKKASLGRPHEIEALRWRALNLLNKLWERQAALRDEIAALGEAFIPQECYAVPDEYPRRLKIDKSRYGDGWSINYDDKFWNYEKPKHKGSPLEELAEIGSLLEWEATILPPRLARVTPEKLDAGLRYFRLGKRERQMWYHIGKLNDILETSIQGLKLIPATRPNVKTLVHVKLNGRLYPFESTGPYAKPDLENWPRPNCPPLVIEVPLQFEVDASLLGQLMDTVRTRIGEPELILQTRKERKWGNVWVYGARGVRFDKEQCVEKILDYKAVTRLLRRM